MHDQLLNHDVARLQRSEFLRDSDRRHRYDRQPRERRAVGQGLFDHLANLVTRRRRTKPSLLTRSV
jgi:hypothetical protein